ncbi:MAG: transglutaminase family protein [Candidatus Dormibacteria bacterium]
MAVISLTHSTVQRYPVPARRSRNEVRLQPRDGAGHRLVAFRLEVSPDAEIDSERDYFDNTVWLVSVEAEHLELAITAHSLVEAEEDGHGEGEAPAAWDPTALTCDPALEFALPSPRVPRLGATAALIRELDLPAHPAAALIEANQRLREVLTYRAGTTSVATPLEDVLSLRAGVCQDFAHVMLAIARELGWPARYVSGYLVPEVEGGAGESHAWVEVCGGDGAWTGYDPTAGSAAGPQHIAVAVGRDYGDAAPVRGTFLSTAPGLPPEVRVTTARGGQERGADQ